jgi:hypothetical protein
VLLHVMLSSILVAIIAAGILRMALLRSSMGARSANILMEKRDDQALLASIIAGWNAAGTPPGSGQLCANVGIAGYSYAGTPGTCSCSYAPTAQTHPPTIPSVSTQGVDPVTGTCKLSLQSADRQWTGP